MAYTPANSPLPDGNINSIYVERGIVVWFATHAGAASLENKSWSIFKDSIKYLAYDNAGNQYVSSNVSSIVRSKDQCIWFGLKGGGVARYNKNSQNGHIWTRFRQPTITFNNVNSLASDLSESSKYGEVWIISGVGVDRFVQNATDDGIWDHFGGLPFSFSQNTVATTNQYDYSIWIGSTIDGMEQVSYFPNLTMSRVSLQSGFASRINGIAFDGDNKVWVATETGVSVLNRGSGTWVQYTPDNTNGRLPPGEIHAIESNRFSDRWFGTDSGLVHLIDTTWYRFTTANSPLPDNTVTALNYDSRGNLWIGTRNGAAVYNPEGTKH